MQPVGRKLSMPAHGSLPKMGEINGGIGTNYRSKQPTFYLPHFDGYHFGNTGQYIIAANIGLIV
jgi:hypothetical protein